MKKTTEQYSKELLDKWNFTLTSEYTGAHGTVSFLCDKGHENVATATNLIQRGYKCKECVTGRKIIPKITWTEEQVNKTLQLLAYSTTEEVAKELNTTVSAINNMLSDKGLSNPHERLTELKLINVLLEQDRELIEVKGDNAVVTCSKGHTHSQDIGNLVNKQTGCPSCFSLGISKDETTLREYIESIYNGWIEYKDRKILDGKELDIILPDIGLAIEYNGTYWHSEHHVPRLYHVDKTDKVEAFGFQLLHIKDYDWHTKRDIVKSIIASKIGITNKIYARNTTLKQIGFPKEFLDSNHIQGSGQPTSLNYGLYYNNELVAVATFAKPRFSNEAELELVRFCSKINTTVVGGLSKLLKPVKNSSILTYACRDYSQGNAYEKVGFKFIRNTEPSMEYFNKLNRVSRYKAQSMSEEDLKGYYKYFNSGNKVYLL